MIFLHFNFSWRIQCCRIGYGTPPKYRKPKNAYSYGTYANATYTTRPPASYSTQYSGKNLGAQKVQRYVSSSDYSRSEAGQMQPVLSGYSSGTAMHYSTPRSLEEEDEQEVLNIQLHEAEYTMWQAKKQGLILLFSSIFYFMPSVYVQW